MATNKSAPRKYPYSAFVLTPAYIVRPVTFVKSGWGPDYDRTAEGTGYRVDKIHATKADAIAYGRKQIVLREEYLEKQHALLDARRIKMDKAEKGN